MHRAIRALAAIGSTLISVGHVGAQEPVVLPAGSLVRVTVERGTVVDTHSEAHDVHVLLARGGRVPGLLERSHPDSISLRGDDGIRTIALSDITRMELGQGRHRHILRGALIGFMLGGTIGAIGGHAAGGERRCNEDGTSCSTSVDAVTGGLAFGLLGALVGGVFGIQSHQTWIEVAPPWRFVPAD